MSASTPGTPLKPQIAPPMAKRPVAVVNSSHRFRPPWALTVSASRSDTVVIAHVLDGLEDECGCGNRLGDESGVRTVDRFRGGPDALGHGALRVGVDGVVVGRHQVPRRNGL